MKNNFMYNGKNIIELVRNMTTVDMAAVAVKIAETHPDVFAQAVVGDVTAAKVVLTGFGNINITHGQLEFLRSLGAGDKVRAVKYFREEFNLNLREAKYLVEDLARQGYVKHKSWIPEWLALETQKDLHASWSIKQTNSDATSLGDILNAQLAENSAVRTVRSNAQIRGSTNLYDTYRKDMGLD